MIVIGLKSKRPFIENLALLFNAREVYIDSDSYPDGECQFQFKETITDQKILLVFDLYPNPQQKCFELLSILHFIHQKITDAQIILLCPYFPFLRECNSSELQVSQMDTFFHYLKLNNIIKIITIDAHTEYYFKKHSIEIININPYPYFLDTFLLTTKNPILVAPDKGSHHKIISLGQDKKLPYILCHKDKSQNRIEVCHTSINNHSKNATYLILDDICDTAKTLLLTTHLLQAAGAENIHIWTTHSFFTHQTNLKELLDNLTGSFSTSDSIEHPKHHATPEILKISILPLIINESSKIKLF